VGVDVAVLAGTAPDAAAVAVVVAHGAVVPALGGGGGGGRAERALEVVRVVDDVHVVVVDVDVVDVLVGDLAGDRVADRRIMWEGEVDAGVEHAVLVEVDVVVVLLQV